MRVELYEARSTCLCECDTRHVIYKPSGFGPNQSIWCRRISSIRTLSMLLLSPVALSDGLFLSLWESASANRFQGRDYPSLLSTHASQGPFLPLKLEFTCSHDNHFYGLCKLYLASYMLPYLR